MSAVTIHVTELRTALLGRRLLGNRWCVYSTHPATGSDCADRTPRPAHGGPLASPWYRGRVDACITRTHRERGRPEVLRTWGVGMRHLLREVQP